MPGKRDGVERELKFACDDLEAVRERLAELEAERLAAAAFEDNLVFDRNGELEQAGSVLRLRSDRRGARLTVKGPARFEEGVKLRDEREISVSNADETQALLEINRIFSTPGTCVVGYNSLRFDDEFMRYGLYRNLIDPYAREWQNNNSRWDIIDLVRATGALRRDGIKWPTTDEGHPVYNLEKMTAANDLEHGSAHDALSPSTPPYDCSNTRLARRLSGRDSPYFAPR